MSIRIIIYVYSKYVGKKSVINLFVQIYKSVEELLDDEYYMNILEKILDDRIKKK